MIHIVLDRMRTPCLCKLWLFNFSIIVIYYNLALQKNILLCLINHWVAWGTGLCARLRSIHHTAIALEAVSSIPGIVGSRAADHTALRAPWMFQVIYPVPWIAAVNPHHLKGSFNVVYFRQWLHTFAQDFYLLIKKSLYEIFSLR